MTIEAFLVDVDGTLYVDGEVIAGAAESIRVLRERGFPLRFLTNTDSVTRETVAGRLRALDIPVEAAEVVTPVNALERRLRQQPGVACYLIVSRELRDELAAYTDGDDVGYVVLGDCRDNFSYELLDGGFRRLRDGAELLALQREPFFLGADGPHMDTGSFVAALEYASGQQAVVLGKPSPQFFLSPVAELGTEPDRIAVVGDDVTTDIAGANAIGAVSILLRTGKYVAGWTPEDEARHVLDSIAELPGLLDRLDP